MNKIFKVKFQHTLGLWVAVSEISRTCAAKKRSLRLALLAALGLVGLNTEASAFAPPGTVPGFDNYDQYYNAFCSGIAGKKNLEWCHNGYINVWGFQSAYWTSSSTTDYQNAGSPGFPGNPLFQPSLMKSIAMGIGNNFDTSLGGNFLERSTLLGINNLSPGPNAVGVGISNYVGKNAVTIGMRNAYNTNKATGQASVLMEKSVIVGSGNNIGGSAILSVGNNNILSGTNANANQAGYPGALISVTGSGNVISGSAQRVSILGNQNELGANANKVVVIGNKNAFREIPNANRSDSLVLIGSNISIPQGSNKLIAIGNNIQVEGDSPISHFTLIGSNITVQKAIVDNYGQNALIYLGENAYIDYANKKRSMYLTDYDHTFVDGRTFVWANAQGEIPDVKNPKYAELAMGVEAPPPEASPFIRALVLSKRYGAGDAATHSWTVVTGVAPGLLSPYSVDAVTGAQAYALSQPLTVTAMPWTQTTNNGHVVLVNGQNPSARWALGTELILEAGRNTSLTFNRTDQQDLPSSVTYGLVKDPVFQSVAWREGTEAQTATLPTATDEYTGLEPIVGLAFNRPSLQVLDTTGNLVTNPNPTVMGIGVTDQGDVLAGSAIPATTPTSAQHQVSAGALSSPSQNAITLGSMSSSSQGTATAGAVVIGAGSQAQGIQNVIVGPNVRITGNQNVVMGSLTQPVTTTGSVFVGHNIQGATQAVAVGHGAQVSNAWDVSLGAASTTTSTKNSATLGNTAGSPAMSIVAGTKTLTVPTIPASTASQWGIVSVGTPGAERRLTHIANGLIGPTSTDLITGQQLYQFIKHNQAGPWNLLQNDTTIGALSPDNAWIIGKNLTATPSANRVTLDLSDVVTLEQAGKTTTLSQDGLVIAPTLAVRITPEGGRVIGHTTQTVGQGSLLIGSANGNLGTMSTGLGTDLTAGNQSTVVGHAITASDNTLAIGSSINSSGTGNVLLTQNLSTQASNATAIGATQVGTNAIAIGLGSQATDNALALGLNAHATGAYDIALGANSVTTGKSDTTQGRDALGATSIAWRPDNTTDTITGTAQTVAPVGVVSVGNRPIKYVAPGLLSATSADAINVEQLGAVKAALTNTLNHTLTTATSALNNGWTSIGVKYDATTATWSSQEAKTPLTIQGDKNVTVTVTPDTHTVSLALNPELKLESLNLNGLTMATNDEGQLVLPAGMKVGTSSLTPTGIQAGTSSISTSAATVGQSTLNSTGLSTPNVTVGNTTLDQQGLSVSSDTSISQWQSGRYTLTSKGTQANLGMAVQLEALPGTGGRTTDLQISAKNVQFGDVSLSTAATNNTAGNTTLGAYTVGTLTPTLPAHLDASGVISVGNKRLTGLSQGLISLTSTDLITGAQLHQAVEAFNNKIQTLGSVALSVNKSALTLTNQNGVTLTTDDNLTSSVTAAQNQTPTVWNLGVSATPTFTSLTIGSAPNAGTLSAQQGSVALDKTLTTSKVYGATWNLTPTTYSVGGTNPSNLTLGQDGSLIWSVPADQTLRFGKGTAPDTAPTMPHIAMSGLVVKNVADGLISETSTDAVTVGQIKKLQTQASTTLAKVTVKSGSQEGSVTSDKNTLSMTGDDRGNISVSLADSTQPDGGTWTLGLSRNVTVDGLALGEHAQAAQPTLTITHNTLVSTTPISQTTQGKTVTMSESGISTTGMLSSGTSSLSGANLTVGKSVVTANTLGVGGQSHALDTAHGLAFIPNAGSTLAIESQHIGLFGTAKAGDGLDAENHYISNVADGILPTDAVTVSQLNEQKTLIEDVSPRILLRVAATGSGESKTYLSNSQGVDIKGDANLTPGLSVKDNVATVTLTLNPTTLVQGSGNTTSTLDASRGLSVTNGTHTTTLSKSGLNTEALTMEGATLTDKTWTAGKNSVAYSPAALTLTGPSVTLGSANASWNSTTPNTINVGNKVITGLKAGEVSPTSHQAITGGQLWQASQGYTLSAGGQSTPINASTKTLTIKGSPQVDVNLSGTTEPVLTLSLKAINDMSLGEQGPSIGWDSNKDQVSVDKPVTFPGNGTTDTPTTVEGGSMTLGQGDVTTTVDTNGVKLEDPQNTTSITKDGFETKPKNGGMGTSLTPEGLTTQRLEVGQAPNQTVITPQAATVTAVGDKSAHLTSDTLHIVDGDHTLDLTPKADGSGSTLTTHDPLVIQAKNINLGTPTVPAQDIPQGVPGVVNMGNRVVQNVLPGRIATGSTDAITGAQVDSWKTAFKHNMAAAGTKVPFKVNATSSLLTRTQGVVMKVEGNLAATLKAGATVHDPATLTLGLNEDQLTWTSADKSTKSKLNNTGYELSSSQGTMRLEQNGSFSAGNTLWNTSGLTTALVRLTQDKATTTLIPEALSITEGNHNAVLNTQGLSLTSSTSHLAWVPGNIVWKTTPDATSVQGSLTAQGDDLTLTGQNVIRIAAQNVSFGAVAVLTDIDPHGIFNVNQRTIDHVAAGVKDTDMVNFSQLTALKTFLDANATNVGLYIQGSRTPSGITNPLALTNQKGLTIKSSSNVIASLDTTQAPTLTLGLADTLTWTGVRLSDGSLSMPGTEFTPGQATSTAPWNVAGHTFTQDGITLNQGAQTASVRLNGMQWGTNAISRDGNKLIFTGKQIHLGDTQSISDADDTSVVLGNWVGMSGQKGTISPTSTDAVIMSQLADIKKDLGNLAGSQNTTVGPNNNVEGNPDGVTGNVISGANNTLKPQGTNPPVDNTITGSGNTTSGSTNTIQGSDNATTGDANTITGSGNSTLGNTNTVTGSGNNTQGNTNTVAGSGNNTKGNTNTIVGSGNTTQGSTNAVVGASNTTEGHSNTIMGSDNHVQGDNNVAAGDNIVTQGHRNVNVGENSKTYGDDNIALGQGAQVGDATTPSHSSVAIGPGAKATGDNNVALGAGSVAANRTDLPQGAIGVVSVGSPDATRIVTGVASGTAGTDAVTVGGLNKALAEGAQFGVAVAAQPDTTGHAQGNAIAHASGFTAKAGHNIALTLDNPDTENAKRTLTINLTPTVTAQSAQVGGELGTHIADSGVSVDKKNLVGLDPISHTMTVGTGTDNIVIAKSDEDAKTALSTAQATHTKPFVALGGLTVTNAGTSSASSSPITVKAMKEFRDALGLGTGNTEDGSNNASLGSNNTTKGDHNLTQGLSNTVEGQGNLTQGLQNTVKGDHSTTLGSHNQVTGSTNVTTGTEIRNSGSGNVVTGQGASAQGTNNVAIGAGSQVSGTNNVALGAGSIASDRANLPPDAVGVVSVGGKVGADGQPETRVISGVLPGTAPTDAVNTAQLHMLSAEQVMKDRQQLLEARDQVRGGIAAGSALGQLALNAPAGQKAVSVGTAVYKNSTALAVGVGMTSSNGRWHYRVNGATSSSGEAVGGAGVGFSW